MADDVTAYDVLRYDMPSSVDCIDRMVKLVIRRILFADS